MTPTLKKHLLYAAPLLIFFYIANLIAKQWRLTAGSGLIRLSAMLAALPHLFQNPIPSLHPADLLFALLCAGILLAVLAYKAKNAKKFRPDVEYGSARWSA